MDDIDNNESDEQQFGVSGMRIIDPEAVDEDLEESEDDDKDDDLDETEENEKMFIADDV